MTNTIQSIALDKLDFHPDNPNRMSKVNFGKLVRNIERSGRYEPLIVRPCPDKADYFQIINGHHRYHALAKLGYETADCIVWDIDDEETDVLLATLNRLGGSDELAKKLKLLKRLSKRTEANILARILPQTRSQIERLNSMLDTLRRTPNGGYSMLDACKSEVGNRKSKAFANSLVFFVDDKQQEQIEKALLLVEEVSVRSPKDKAEVTRAAKRAAALTHIAGYFLNHSKINSET